MKLKSVEIEGFRRHYSTKVLCEDATFLIGSNNAGKSSILKALKYLLEDKNKMDIDDFCCFLNEDNEKEQLARKVVITAEFKNLREEALEWRGFNHHRLFKNDDFEKDGYSIFYRKTFDDSGKCKIEMKQNVVSLKEEYSECKTVQDYIDKGLNADVLDEILGNKPRDKTVSKSDLKTLEADGLEELFNFDESTEWFENPGGISQNVSSKLPKFLLIEDQSKNDELSGPTGALMVTLKQLFDDVREESDNFKQAQYYLNQLAQELDPQDESSEFADLLNDLNGVVGDVFPDTSFIAQANLSNANDVIKPKFDVQLGSNIHTSVENQGAGVVRSAIFAMLRYRNMRENKKKQHGEYIRPLFIAFEEPEIYLHPQAAKQMKETIYNLSMQENNQIICTTHSPYMINLSKETNQILNTFSLDRKEINIEDRKVEIDHVIINPFNISSAFQSLVGEDKSYIKMLLRVDDSVAKIFFVKNVLIVEGDTEEIVFRETMTRMSDELYKEFSYNWEVIRARGKATIIPLIKYLKSMGINPYVIHDRDANTPNAFKFNLPISEALNDDNRLYVLEECMEDLLGYTASSNDKPYKAYQFITENWEDSWEDVNENWREIINSLNSK